MVGFLMNASDVNQTSSSLLVACWFAIKVRITDTDAGVPINGSASR